MTMVNHVILVGHLTRDAESLPGARGPMTRMRLATHAQWRDVDGNRQESTEFHNIVAFTRLAEICAQYCLKGRRIYVEGRLRTRDYEGSDGLRRTSTDVVIDTMRLLDRREHEGALELIPPGGSVSPIPAGSGLTQPEATEPEQASTETGRVPALSAGAAS
jgi:single-strand DNA-binding protein